MLVSQQPWLAVVTLFIGQLYFSFGWIPIDPKIAKRSLELRWSPKHAEKTPTALPERYRNSPSAELCSRRQLVKGTLVSLSMIVFQPLRSNAAPPMSVMMEELGYFPVGADDGTTEYAPARIQRESSAQAVALANYMRQQKISMAGAYWCPHCRRQRELFGRQAWALVSYQECDPKGYQHATCPKQVTAYPTWLKGKRKDVIATGELSLGALAEIVGFNGFDEALEQSLPPLIGASSCGK